MTSSDDSDAEMRRTPSVWNVANLLTVARLVMVPAFVAALLAADNADDATATRWRLAACVLFAVALSTDYADGVIARARNLVTPFGQLADPIADKALTGAALIGLAVVGLAPWWAVVLILGREVGITVLRLWVVKRYAAAGVIPASRGGKLKTAVQGLAIGWILLPWAGFGFDAVAVVGVWLLWLAVVITLVTGLDYVRQAVQIVRREGRDGRR